MINQNAINTLVHCFVDFYFKDGSFTISDRYPIGKDLIDDGYTFACRHGVLMKDHEVKTLIEECPDCRDELS